MPNGKQTNLIKTAAARFQWEGRLQYQNRRYIGDVLATTYEEARVEVLLAALQEWDLSTLQNMDFLSDYIAKNPSKLSLKLKDSLDTVIARYALSKKYNDPMIAMDQCIIASKRLKKFIEALGFEARAITLKNPKQQYPEAVFKWRKFSSAYWTHHVVSVGERVYDLTFRQFDPNAAYPFFTTLTELKKNWKEIYIES